jgi:hypothetical protein
MGKAEAQLSWFGFSDLCFKGTFKGGSVTSGVLSITLISVDIRAGCYNTQSGAFCQSGGGNAGDFTLTADATADPTKAKGIISAEGCLSDSGVFIAKWDNHSLQQGDPGYPHQHICQPLSNTNKIEILGSGYIPQINTQWALTNNGKVISSGFQTCNWDGFIDPATCKPCTEVNPDDPACKKTFTCPIDVVNPKK